MAPKLVITDSETGESFQVDLLGEAVRIGRPITATTSC